MSSILSQLLKTTGRGFKQAFESREVQNAIGNSGRLMDDFFTHKALQPGWRPPTKIDQTYRQPMRDALGATLQDYMEILGRGRR